MRNKWCGGYNAASCPRAGARRRRFFLACAALAGLRAAWDSYALPLSEPHDTITTHAHGHGLSPPASVRRVAAPRVRSLSRSSPSTASPACNDPSTVNRRKRQDYVYAHGRRPADVDLRRWLVVAAGRLRQLQAVPGGQNRGPDVIARGGNNSGRRNLIHLGDKYFLYYFRARDAAESAIGLFGRQDPRSRVA